MINLIIPINCRGALVAAVIKATLYTAKWSNCLMLTVTGIF